MGHAGPEEVVTRADLARELSAIRAQAGLTVRELAQRVGAPTATVGDYFAGRHLPGPAQTALFRALLVECGVAGPVETEAWLEVLGRVRLASDGRSPKSESPYQGLEPYGEANAELFFGRAAATAELIGLLARLATDGGPSHGLVVVVGPSGSGKSSLLAAGLIPSVRSGALDGDGESWDCVLTTAVQLAFRLSAPATGHRELLVVDQLEEVLAADPHSPERRDLLDALAGAQSERRLIVAALRADFYQAALAEPILLAALRHAQIVLGPLTEDELREAIVEPARRVGASVDEGLVDLVLGELALSSAAGAAHDDGALPLVSHVMWVLWGRARRNALTAADYRAVGGLAGAVSQSAEELYGGLSPAEQALTRRIFSRLVRIDPEGPITRRRLPREELDSLTDTPDTTRGLLESLISARLLSADESSIQISHEALLRAWPRLGEWLGADRVALRVHCQLRDAANAWAGAGRDESLLWRGARLAAASEWAEEPDHRTFLNVTEAQFLADSLASHRAAQQATRRRARQMRQLVVTLAVLVLVAGALAGYALHSRGVAATARDQALSRQVAIEARQLAPTEPALAAQLALTAFRVSPTLQARSALIDATAGEIPTRLLGPTGPTFVSVSGQLMAAAESGADAVQLYSLAGSGPVKLGHLDVGPAADQDYAVALSPDGSLLAAGGTNDSITLWNVASPKRPAKLAVIAHVPGTVYSLAFSPDSHGLAAADSDGSVSRWDVNDPRHPVALAKLHAPGGASLKALAYGPDGARLAAAGSGGTLLVWRAGQSSPQVVSGSGTITLESVAFSPDGSTLAVGGDDGSVRGL